MSAARSQLQNLFAAEVRSEHRVEVVIPSGELDLATAPELEAALERAWQSGAELVMLDLRALEFMDSTGLHIIVGAHQRAQECDRRFGVVDGGEQIHKLLGLTGVLDRLNLVAAPDRLPES